MSNHYLLQRIQRVLGAHGPEKRAPWMAGALALCTATIGLATLWPVQAHSAPTPQAPQSAETKQTDGRKSGIKTTQSVISSSIVSIGTSVNGKSIGIKFDSKTPDLTPDYPITVEGQKKRFGDLNDEEQDQLCMIVASTRIRTHRPNTQFGLGTGVNGKSIGLTVDSNTPGLTLETPVTVEGKPKRFGDLSDDEQEQISAVVAVTRLHAQRAPRPAEARRADEKKTGATITQSSWSVGIGTGINGKSVGLVIDSKTPDPLPADYPIKVEGQQKRFGDLSDDEQAQLSYIVAETRKDAEKRAAEKRADEKKTVTTTTQSSWSVGIGTGVNGKSIGLVIDSKTPDPLPADYPITVEGQKKRFDDLNDEEQAVISMIVTSTRKNMSAKSGGTEGKPAP
jgi:hypothetical protein